MKGNKIRHFFEAQAARDSAHFPVIAFQDLGPASFSSRASILAGLGAFRSNEPNALVGGDRPNEGARRLNHASLEIREVLAEAAARDGPSAIPV
jgi:hypothetical protein